MLIYRESFRKLYGLWCAAPDLFDPSLLDICKAMHIMVGTQASNQFAFSRKLEVARQEGADKSFLIGLESAYQRRCVGIPLRTSQDTVTEPVTEDEIENQWFESEECSNALDNCRDGIATGIRMMDQANVTYNKVREAWIAQRKEKLGMKVK